MTLPKPGLPTSVARGSQKIPIINHRNKDNMKLLQKATFVDSSRSTLSVNSCWIRYFWKPASVNISAKVTIMVMVATTPNASGVNRRARTILVIGNMSFAINSVIADHFVAFATTLLFTPDIFYIICLPIFVLSDSFVNK